MFPDRRQSQGLNQSLGQGLNPISTYSPLDTYNTRQFDPSGFDNRSYLNSTVTWKENGPMFQHVDTDVSSSNLQNSLLQNEGHNGLSSIPPSSAAYSSQSLRMLNNGDPQLPYFNQAPLASVSQQGFPNYQSITTPSNNQSPGMSVAHMSPATTETSFIRRYPSGTGIMGGMDPLNLTNEMNYPNQGYTTQLNGLDTFGRNALNPFVDNTNPNQELKSRVNPEFQYNSRNGNGNGNGNGNTHNLVDNPNSISNESHLQVDRSYNDRYQPGASTNGNNSNLIPEIIQPTSHGVVNHSLKHIVRQEIEAQKYPQPLTSVQHSAYSPPQFPGNGTVTPGQISMSPEYQGSENVQDEMLSSSTTTTTTQFKDRTPSTSVKTKASKEKSKNSKPIPSNLTPSGQKLKRPMNAFLIYASQRRPQLQETDPTMTTAAQSKILGDEWAKMEDSRKLDYVERARSLKTEFLETNPDYVYTRRPNNTKKKYRRRSAGDDGSSKLKRPMNAYLLFNKEMRHKLLETNPNMSVAEISKEIGDRWKSLGEEERNKYFTEAQSLKKDFLATNPDFIYTRRSKAEIEAERKRNCDEEPVTKDPRGRKKKKQKNPAAPKHPMSGFLFYLSAIRPRVAEQYPGSTVGPISKIIAHQWNLMVPEERAPWDQKAAEDKARYAREMEVYLAEKQ